MPPKAKALTFQQIRAIATRNGALPGEAVTLAAIAMAESSGIPNNRKLDGQHGKGLWQIDDRYHKYDPKMIDDPDYNAKWAIRVMRESKAAGKDPFKPWAAYNSGKHKPFLAQAKGPAVKAPERGPMSASAAKDVTVNPQMQANTEAQMAGQGAGGGTVKGILDKAMSFLGTPYKWGGASPETGFDCSGLLQYAFAQNGITIPRVSRDQARAGVGVGADQAQAGDLIAFDNSSARPGVDHIGIYLGNGLMLQAPKTGSNVQVVKVDLGRAAAIRRIPQAKYTGLQASSGKVVYPAAVGERAVSPTSITTETGGSDPVAGQDPNEGLLGPDGKVNPGAAIAKYGYIAGLANSVPDIKKVLTDAITNGWEPQRFAAEIQRTAWWRKTSDQQRRVTELKATNPGEYRRQRQAMIDKINIMSRQLGAKEGTQRVFILAERFLSLGSSDQEIQRLIAADVRIAPGGKANTGEAAVTVDSLRAMARAQGVTLTDAQTQQWTSAILRGDLSEDAYKSFLLAEAKKANPDMPASAFERGETVDSFNAKRSAAIEALTAEAKSYLVPMSEEALKKWATQVVSGDVSPESFTSYVKEQAKSLFPTLGAAIDRGVTVAQYAEPYRQIAAQTLEINPDDVDFSNPTYGKALMQVDPKTGERTSMGLAEFGEYLRKQPAWQKTRGANEKAASLTEQLLKTFGAVA